MNAAYLALALTMASTGFDRVEVIGGFPSLSACSAYLARERSRRPDIRVGCVAGDDYRSIRSGIFQR